MRTSLFSLVGLVALLTLAACGGGGADGGSNPPPPPPPPPPPALAPFFAPTGIPVDGTTSFPLAVGESADGRVFAGGFSDFPADSSALQMRPICAEFAADGTPVGLATLTDGGANNDGICFAVDPAGTFLAGTVGSPNTAPNHTDREAVTWAPNGAPTLNGSLSPVPYSAAHRGTNRAGDRVGTDSASVPVMLPAGASQWMLLPVPAGSDGGGVAGDISDNGIVAGDCGVGGFALHATVWRTPLLGEWLPEPVDAAGSIAFCISDNGNYIGGVWGDFESGNKACRWVWNSDTQLYDFEDLGVSGAVMFVTNTGICFGGNYVASEFFRSEAGSDSAWIWDSVNGVTSLRSVLAGLGLDVSHFTSLDIVNGGADLGDHFVLAGDGVNGDLAREGFVVRIPAP